ncbi:MAG: hypothetical protein A2498_05280 [Lentisphaerae bacterium RIFOXYC12_FULL_60_16]|nr:MAG: hypothetical protein A2498_05280 [Lentisphaerae bacterium RIFOXYC12_FULL_60_16]OGV74212.1 MAG: hypothetical protein A2269_07370 [Lentisphaerae bacterium RIFOXYA12_FULL_60_10]OGV85233.1 MAG: hypothetical protein A2340_16070 [Lentisphaerae bacterium RIFOXYB12_FULL_60_10]
MNTHAGLSIFMALAFGLAGCSKAAKPGNAPTGIRIVSLAPSLTEIVCAIAGTEVLAGRTSACDYPPEIIDRVPIVGGFGVPSIETILSIEPTIILEADLADQTMANQMEALGLRRERIACKSVRDIPLAIEKVGTLIGYEPQALELAGRIRSELADWQARSETSGTHPLVYAEIWNDPITTAGTNSFLSDLINLAGGRNLGDQAGNDYFTLDPEWILKQNPDIILCFYMSREGTVRETVLKRPGWAHVKAVTNGAVYDGFDNNIILRPGPRVIQGIEALHRSISQSVP